MSKSVVFKIATANLQSLPKLPSITKGLNSVAGTHLFGFQEDDLPDYKRATLKRFPQAVGIGTPAGLKPNTFSCALGYNRATFDLLASGTRKLYDGHEGISLTRNLVHGHLLHRGARIQLGAVNLHSVVTKGSNQAQRRAMKAAAKDATFKATRVYTGRGLPAVVMGDFNDTVNWFGAKFDGHKVTKVGHGIDQIILIDSATHYWRVLSVKTRETPSDHDTLRVKVELIAR